MIFVVFVIVVAVVVLATFVVIFVVAVIAVVDVVSVDVVDFFKSINTACCEFLGKSFSFSLIADLNSFMRGNLFLLQNFPLKSSRSNDLKETFLTKRN